jgi:diguanylate cyclase (GGDEF)-like protein
VRATRQPIDVPEGASAVGVRTRERGRAPDEVAALTRVSAAAADAYRLEDVLEQAAEAALEVTGAASLSVSRWERERDAMQTLINVGDIGPGEERFPADEVYPLADYPIVAELLRDGKPYYSAVDDPRAPSTAVELLRQTGKESELAVPIVLDGRVWGEVWATTANGSPRFDEGDVRFLQAIADRLALVLSRAERYTRVSRLAYEDPLTGLANRRAIEEQLDFLLGGRGSRRRPLTLLLCDVDGLKDINDAHGHYAGDRALCRVAEALDAAAAPASAALVGRLAGDEFCVVLEGADPSVATDVATATLERLTIEHELPLSVSMGAATAGPDMTPADLLHAADRAQYAAKRRGGGRLCTADAESLPDEVAGPIQTAHSSPERRVDEATEDVLDILDADLAGRPVLDRIEAVAGALSGAVNAAAWAVARWEERSEVVTSLSSADDRASRMQGTRVQLQRREWPLAKLPELVELVARGNGSRLVRVDDPDVSSSARETIRGMGFVAGLSVTVEAADGVYVLSVLADSHSGDLAPAAVRAQLLLRVAAAPVPAS